MTLTLFLIALVTSVVGSICGIGGGVIIKPVLDAMNILSVPTISFLSGCTVLAMAVVSVGKSALSGRAQINKRTTPMLGIGAAVGGVVGKLLFARIVNASGDDDVVGLTQAIVLAAVTLGTLVYMMLNNSGKIRTRNVQNLIASAGIGLVLGLVSSFLGIGGGPINLAVLAYFFSMDTKEAGTNSLCVILISQTAALIQTFAADALPEFQLPHLVFMVVGGIAGGLTGQYFKRKLDTKQVTRLFYLLIVVVVAVCIYNALRFAGILVK